MPCGAVHPRRWPRASRVAGRAARAGTPGANVEGMDVAEPLEPAPASPAGPRRRATVSALDARLSAWGRAARDAAGRRAEVVAAASARLPEAALARVVAPSPALVDPASALLAPDVAALLPLAASVLPSALRRSRRLLWVDPERVAATVLADLAPHVEAARREVRRRQALYRRRARLWAADPARLEELREELEGLRLPRTGEAAVVELAALLPARLAPGVSPGLTGALAATG
jgi:hypothetical protein